jgi:hypothetical protein
MAERNKDLSSLSQKKLVQEKADFSWCLILEFTVASLGHE